MPSLGTQGKFTYYYYYYYYSFPCLLYCATSNWTKSISNFNSWGYKHKFFYGEKKLKAQNENNNSLCLSVSLSFSLSLSVGLSVHQTCLSFPLSVTRCDPDNRWTNIDRPHTKIRKFKHSQSDFLNYPHQSSSATYQCEKPEQTEH